LRDRGRIFGDGFTKQIQDMGIKEMPSAPRSTRQRIAFNEVLLYRHVKSFAAYCRHSRTPLSPAKDSRESRPVQPPELGRVVAIPQVRR
jgi:hypothetical protein